MKSLEQPNDNLRAAILTTEMGINADDVEAYYEFRQKIRQETMEREREARIAANQCIKDLGELYDFKFIESKQYPNHKHFTFKDKKGLEIRGRTFRHTWNGIRLWLYWRDAKNQRKSLMFNYDWHSKEIVYPTNFPKEWSEQRSYTTYDPYIASHLFAHKIANKAMPKGFPYPKK